MTSRLHEAKPFHVLRPIPQREIDTNKKLKPNTGY
ncbi:RagB/SusD family nutrient uptake outer membrane protein [Spirosoma fluviale]